MTAIIILLIILIVASTVMYVSSIVEYYNRKNFKESLKGSLMDEDLTVDETLKCIGNE